MFPRTLVRPQITIEEVAGLPIEVKHHEPAVHLVVFSIAGQHVVKRLMLHTETRRSTRCAA